MFTVAVNASEIKKVEDVKISSTAKKQFESEFKNAQNVSWTVKGAYQKASFSIENKRTTAFYDLSGEFMGATQFVNYEDLPIDARKQVETSYKGYVVNDVVQVVSRPLDSDLNDVGTYWIGLVNDKKEVYLKIASAIDVQIVKQTALAKQ